MGRLDFITALVKDQQERDQVLSEIVEEQLLEADKRSWLKKGAEKVYTLAKMVATPAVIGAGFGYLSSGVDGVQQGALVGSAFGVGSYGLGQVIAYFSKDEMAENPALRLHEAVVKSVKSDIKTYKNGSIAGKVIGGPIIVAGVYAGLAWAADGPVGLAAKIGAVQGLLAVGKIYKKGRSYSRKIDRRIEQKRVERMDGPYVDMKALGSL